MRGGTHLYIIQSHTTGAFKVGRSSNPERRLRQLQTGCPYKLKLILVLENQGHRERFVHGKLSGYRSQGDLRGEWFVETGLGSLPSDVYEQLDLEVVNSWWVTDKVPADAPGPPSMKDL